jgi:hypothetical protein
MYYVLIVQGENQAPIHQQIIDVISISEHNHFDVLFFIFFEPLPNSHSEQHVLHVSCHFKWNKIM